MSYYSELAEGEIELEATVNQVNYSQDAGGFVSDDSPTNSFEINCLLYYGSVAESFLQSSGDGGVYRDMIDAIMLTDPTVRPVSDFKRDSTVSVNNRVYNLLAADDILNQGELIQTFLEEVK